jgi:predicted N-acyltransferase
MSETIIENQKFSIQILELKNEVLENLDFHHPSFFSSKEFLANTQYICPQLQHHILEIKKEGVVLGNLYFQVMPFKGAELKSYIPQNEICLISKTMEAIVDMALDRIHWNLAVLGNVFITGDNGQYWLSDLSPEIKWQLIHKATKVLAKSKKIDAFLVSDLTLEQLDGKEAIMEKGYRLFEVEPDMVFNIPSEWQSFDDYIASLISKYRVRTKKVLEKSQALVIRNLELSDIDAYQNELFQLYKNVMDNAAFRLAEIRPNYFHDFKKAYPNNFWVRAYFIDNTLVGFISFFSSQQALNINFVGLDYQFNKDIAVYQRILYDCIDQGIILKKQNIHFGRTASEIKTAVGAVPITSYSMLKHNSTLPNLAIKPLTTYLKPEPFEVRKPFGEKKVS